MDQLLNLFGQMMRVPLDMMAAGTGWISQMGQGMRVSSGQPANTSAAAFAGAGAGAVPAKAGGMQVLVVFEVFHTIVEPKRLQLAITQTHATLSRIFASGAAQASGAFAGKRGGFFLLNVASGEELLLLMSPGLSDNCTIDMYPILSFAEQAAVFQQVMTNQ